MNAKIISAFLVLAFASLACGFSINLPNVPTPGPVVIDEINVPVPAADDVSLHLSFGAGDLKLNPGAGSMVEGTATYNYSEFKPVINTDKGDIHIQVGDDKFNALPAFKDLKNEWDLKLGSVPMDLSIESGAYKGNLELGGLALKNLTIKDGAATVQLAFSEPNLVEMSTFRYETGASDVKMSGLANANFSILDFSSGAGDYTLDFSGKLQRDASIKVSSGLSNIIVNVPENVNAVVTIDSGASNVSVGSSWSKNGNVFEQKGDGPTLTFVIDIGAGNVTLTK